jgi:hypothetical protein
MNGYGDPADAQAAFQLQPGQNLSGILQAYMAQQKGQQAGLQTGGNDLMKAIADLMKKKKLSDMAASLGGNPDAVNQGYDPSQIQGTASLSDSLYT